MPHCPHASRPREYTMCALADLGDFWYIVDSGTLDVYKKPEGETVSKKVNSYKVGDSFGELALLNEKPRAATVTAMQPTFCIILTKRMFRKAIEDLKDGKFKPIVEFLSQTPIF